MLGHRMRMAAGGYSAAASSSGTSFTMESLFTAAQWTSNATKRVIVPNGVHLGSSNASAALTIGATAWGGDLILEVQSGGIISGSGGAAGTAGAGGVGGNAFDANRLGASSQKVIVNILAGGTIRGGGGGGGKGGAGGAGTATVTEGPTYDATHYWQMKNSVNFVALWPGVANYSFGTQYYITSYSNGGWTYIKGAFNNSYTDGSDNFIENFKISRQQVQATAGGAGGAGGRGQGYDGANVSGSAGAAGGTNAGTGGTGGAGATYGATGSTGSTGAAGNAGSGVAGSSGGLAGYYIANRTANATVNNSGTVQGQ